MHPAQIAIVRFAPGVRPKAAERIDIATAPQGGEPEWQPSLAALRNWLEQAKPKRAEIEFVLSDRLLHYALVPWTDRVRKPAEETIFSRIYFENLFGKQAAGWHLKLASDGYGKARVGVAAEGALVDELKTLCTAHRLKLLRVTPYLMAVFNHWRKQLDGKNSVLAIAEAGSYLLGTFKNGEWHSLRRVAAGGLIGEDLPRAIEREVLLHGLEGKPKLYFHSPEHGLAGEIRRLPGMTILEWPTTGARPASAAMAMASGGA